MKNKAVKVVWSIVVGFFTLVFIIGFFSKSIINLFLPKAQVTAAISGPVERTLDIEGIVEAQESVKIRLAGNVIVEEYFIKPGDVIAAGNPIFRINTGFGIKNGSTDAGSLQFELEREELKLQSLEKESFKAEEMDIEVLEGKLERGQNDFAKKEALYKAGAIAAAELESYRAEILEQELNLEKAKLMLEENRGRNLLEITNSKLRIKELKHDKAAIEKKRGFYSAVDDKGVCCSGVSGIVLFINLSDAILTEDTIIAEIAQIDKDTGLAFSAKVHEEEYDFIKNIEKIELKSDYSNSSYSVKITDISKIVSEDMVSIRGVFTGEISQGLKIGQKMKGKLKTLYSEEGLIIPKSSLIPDERFVEGQMGKVYILEEKDGILGKENLSREVRVKILAVGDSKVIVSGLEAFDNPRVITNLSYKINDGAKVFLWE